MVSRPRRAKPSYQHRPRPKLYRMLAIDKPLRLSLGGLVSITDERKPLALVVMGDDVSAIFLQGHGVPGAGVKAG